ncbi:TonB-dependent receptor plug domain-containing protein [Falsiroseomonas sp. E2-1-a20]|uniref:TonB-dependent receptor plug domain-containing protein n=1 Tax=Falsiroseomonas sp. E2-1-a20 TaxID=3239300 RepID=UPI003F2A1D9E
MTHTLNRMRAALLAGAALVPLPVAAQTMDYGALEALFGEPVTASATGKPQRASDAPVSMDIISAEQIRRSGARDIPGVLQRYTTLDVMQNNANDANVAVRGMNTPMTPRLLVLVDGRQVYVDDYGRTAWALVPVELAEIRQIEVVKGPNSALFGFNATAGVINIITFNPAYERVNTGTLRSGTGQYREASVIASAPVGDGGGVRLSAGIRSEDTWSNGFTGGERAGRADRDPESYRLAATSLFRVADGVQVGLDANASRSLGTLYHPGASQFWTDQRSLGFRGRIAAETSFGLLESSVAHSTMDIGFLRQNVTVVQLSDTLKIGAAHAIRPSAEYRRNQMSLPSGQRVAYDVFSAGMMWNWAISDQLESTLAGRWDQMQLEGSGYGDGSILPGDADYDRSIGTFAYNAGLVWKATPDDTFRLAAARGIGSPSLVDLGLILPILGTPLTVVGNPALDPVVVDNFELGWTRRIAAISGQVGASVFYQINNDLSSSVSAQARFVPGAGVISSPGKAGSTDVYGVDLSARGELPQGFDWGLGYRLAQVDGDLSTTSSLAYTTGSPLHLATARLGWSAGPIRLDGFARYQTRSSQYRLRDDGLFLVTASDQVWAGMRAAWRPVERLEFALEADGVVTEQQDAGITLEPERRVYLSVRVSF